MAINIAKLPSVHVKLDRPKRKRNVEKEINTEREKNGDCVSYGGRKWLNNAR